MKLKKVLIILFSLFIFIGCVNINTIYAAGTIKPDKTSLILNEGSSTTFDIIATNATGRISVISKNENVASISGGSISEWINENSSMTITIKGISEGTTTIVVSLVDCATLDTEEEITGAYIIHVTVNPKSDASVKKSSIKTLASLSIEGFETEEKFAADRTSYTVYAPKNTEYLNITAVSASSKATISEIDGRVSEGWNTIEFSCIAEDETDQIYTISVYVEETPDVFFNDGKLGIVKNVDKVVAPEGFEANTITIDNKKECIFQHDNIYLLYLVDEDNNKDFYVYNKEENKIFGKYNLIEINGNTYLKLDFSYIDFEELNDTFIAQNIKIDDIEFKGWKYQATNMDDFALIYLMDEEGNRQLYRYDFKEKTLQRYIQPIIEQKETTNQWQKMYPTICMCVGIAGIISFIAALVVVGKKKNKK